MKVVSNDFKNAIKQNGRELDTKITLYDSQGNVLYTLTNNDIVSTTIDTNTNILKSVMQEVDFETRYHIENYENVRIKLEFGVKVGNVYEYIDYGYFNIKEEVENKEVKTYTYTCYDDMLKTMIPYTGIDFVEGDFPMYLDDFVDKLCTKLDLSFFNYQDNYTNYDLVLTDDYWNYENTPYTFRDVLDQIAEAVGGFITCKNDTIKIIYPTEQDFEINDDDIKDSVCITDGVVGPIDGIISTRADSTDSIEVNIYEDERKAEHPIVIKENLMLNNDYRIYYINEMLARIEELTYAKVDFATIGNPYLETGDIYNIVSGKNNILFPKNTLFPSNVLFPNTDNSVSLKTMFISSTIKIQNGLEQSILTEEPYDEIPEYVNSNATPITDKQAKIIVDKKLKEVVISADKIHLEGYTTINGGLSVDLEGNMKAKSGEIGSWDINNKGLYKGDFFIQYGSKDVESTTFNYGTSNIYTIADYMICQAIILGTLPMPTLQDQPAVFKHYDVDNNGTINARDLLIISKMIEGVL